jgi:hypothetical protein
MEIGSLGIMKLTMGSKVAAGKVVTFELGILG